MVYVELFELCETTPKVQFSQCLLYWNQGVIYCTCGHFLVERESRRKLTKLRLDALSIPHYVIKKGPPHGARHGNTEAQKEYHIAYNAWKRCCKRVDGQEEHYQGINDRFSETKYIVNRNSKLAGPSRSASRWTSWHRRITPTVYPRRNFRDIKDSGISH